MRGATLALLALALAAAGCGASNSSSNSPFAGPRRVPTGFSVYYGSGFSVAVPTGYEATSTAVAGAPAGSTVVRLSSAGSPPQMVNAEVLVAENPHLALSLDQVVNNLRASERATTTRLLAFDTRTVGIPGAREARLINESYVAPLSGSQPIATTFDRTWLMVQPRPGVLLDVIAANEPGRGGTLNLNAVIHSFRLNR